MDGLRELEHTVYVMDIIRFMRKRIEEGKAKGQDVTLHKHIEEKVTDLFVFNLDLKNENDLQAKMISNLELAVYKIMDQVESKDNEIEFVCELAGEQIPDSRAMRRALDAPLRAGTRSAVPR